MPQKKINVGRSAQRAVSARRDATASSNFRKQKEDKWNSDIKKINKKGGFGAFAKSMTDLAGGSKESDIILGARIIEKRDKARAVEMEKKYLADREEMKRRLRRKK